MLRETIERGGPLLIVETKVNGDSSSTYEWNPSLVGLLGRYKRFYFPALGRSSPPRIKHFLLTVHYFTSFLSITQQAGQAVVPRHLSIYMFLWLCRLLGVKPQLRFQCLKIKFWKIWLFRKMLFIMEHWKCLIWAKISGIRFYISHSKRYIFFAIRLTN